MSKNMLLVFSTRTSSSCQRLSAIFISMTLLARIHSCIIHCSFSGLHFSARKLGFWLLLAASNLDCLPLAGFEFCILKVRGRGFFRPCCNSIFDLKRAWNAPNLCSRGLLSNMGYISFLPHFELIISMWNRFNEFWTNDSNKFFIIILGYCLLKNSLVKSFVEPL